MEVDPWLSTLDPYQAPLSIHYELESATFLRTNCMPYPQPQAPFTTLFPMPE